jgi:hypothetical protein
MEPAGDFWHKYEYIIAWVGLLLSLIGVIPVVRGLFGRKDEQSPREPSAAKKDENKVPIYALVLMFFCLALEIGVATSSAVAIWARVLAGFFGLVMAVCLLFGWALLD